MRARWGDVVDGAVGTSLPGGAALAADGRAWVLIEDAPEHGLGAALGWARRYLDAKGEIHLLVTGSGGLLARRAELFEGNVAIWEIEGTSLRMAAAAALAPEPAIDPAAEPFVAVFERAGAEPVIEAGILRAEILGLEVARVEVDEAGARLRVGVGKHDREAHREVHGTDHGFDDLFEVVRIVAEHRVAGGEGHAAYHLSTERWLRAVVTRHPSLVGAADLHAVAPPVVRLDLRQAATAPAAGHDIDGAALIVVCSVGADLDLVPSAADAWLADGREPRLRICVPEGDDYPVTHDLVARLSIPAELTTVAADWRVL